GGAGRVEGGQNVLRRNTISVGESLQRAEVLTNGLRARIDLQQNLIEAAGGLPHALTLTADTLRQRREDRVELRRVDLVEQPGEVLEDGVDLGADVVRFQHRPRGHPRSAGNEVVQELDVLRTED